MAEYKIPLEVIEKFLIGHDDEKYIVNLEYDRKTNLIYKFKQFPDGTKTTETEPLRAFLWMKNLNSLRTLVNFYDNSDIKTKLAIKEYGITIISLEHNDEDRLINGFKYILVCDQGYDRMQKFFYNGGFYRGIYDTNHDIRSHFLMLTPVEQYLISTGKRLFKGYDDYDDIEKFVFDLETTGLDPKTSRIFLIGCKTNKGFEALFHAEVEGDNADVSEATAIVKFFTAIQYIQPTIIAGYNSANFDWDFIFKRCEILHLDIEKIAKTLKDDEKIVNKNSKIKYGSDVESYVQTNMFGYSVIDIIHAARKGQAIDSNMKFVNLKYVCKYNEVAKKNRVYIPGDKIGKTWVSTKKYWFDEHTGVYLEFKPTIEKMDFITRIDVQNNPDKIFIFGDNDERIGLGGQAKEMRGENNTIGIPTKKTPSSSLDSYYTDEEFDLNKKKINYSIKLIIDAIKDGKTIVLPSNYVGGGLSDLPNKAPKTYDFLISSLSALEKYCDSYTECDGEYIVKRYLMDDLWETLEVDNIYNQSTFMLAKLMPLTYQRVSTIGTAGLWKMIMLTWSYERGLAVPIPEEKRDFVGGLSRLLKVGFSQRLRKLDFDSLYPSVELLHDLFPSVDITGVLKSFLKYFHTERFEAKKLSENYKKLGKQQLASLFKRKQIPLKIFINSLFGAVSAPNAFPWAEIDKGEGITCASRQYLRFMINYFTEKGYTPTLIDTDGVNFIAPKEGEDDFIYTGKGINAKVEEGKVYHGIRALIAEFNDLYMHGDMALGFDGQWPATINLSRKNYVLLEEDGTIKLTSATIKSKKMPVYIEEFLDKAFILLLNNKGYEFLQFYYSYVDLIYSKKIPLVKIATKARVKKTILEYKNRGKNKKGNLLPKQAHMELAINHKLKVDLGDTIYYVNNGDKKTNGDTGMNKEMQMYAQLISKETLEQNPNALGEYNVKKYLAMLNSRITKLCIVFDKSVRDQILIDHPDKKRSWLLSETELVSGQPFNDFDQDTIEEVFTPSDKELEFWSEYEYNPDFWFENNVVFEAPSFTKKIKNID